MLKGPTFATTISKIHIQLIGAAFSPFFSR